MATINYAKKISELEKLIATQEPEGQKLIKEKIARLKADARGEQMTAKQLAAQLLRQRERLRDMSKRDVRNLLRTLMKKPEYSFLKRYTKDDVIRDLSRTAKPVGYRFKGKHNYKVPTPAQVRRGLIDGTVYSERRPKHSDVSSNLKLRTGGQADSMLSESKIREILAESGKTTATAMYAYLKHKYAGRFDVAVAKKNAKEMAANMKGYMKYMKHGGDVDADKEEILVRGKVAAAVGIDKAIQMLNTHYVVHPFDMIKIAVRKGWITLDEINEELVENAEWEAKSIDSQYRDSGQGIGGSDRFYFAMRILSPEQYRKASEQLRSRKYEDGGGIEYDEVDVENVDINDLNIPVSYTMFEEEMYEYKRGGGLEDLRSEAARLGHVNEALLKRIANTSDTHMKERLREANRHVVAALTTLRYILQ